MKKTINSKCFVLVSLVFVALFFTLTPAWSADRSAADMSYRSDKQELPPTAIEKTGFFHGVDKGRVKIKNQETYRMHRYIAAADMIITFEGEEIDLLRIQPSSIVKLIIVNSEVVEIVLVEVSS